MRRPDPRRQFHAQAPLERRLAVAEFKQERGEAVRPERLEVRRRQSPCRGWSLLRRHESGGSRSGGRRPVAANVRPTTFLGREGSAYVGFEASYRSDFSSNASPSIYTNIKGYSLANFRAGFRTDEGFDIFGWVRNAFDEEYFEQLALGPGNTGLIVGQPGDERTWGLTVKGEF